MDKGVHGNTSSQAPDDITDQKNTCVCLGILYFKKDEYKFIVIDAALLIETKLNEMSDQVWLVHADEKLKIKRLIERDKLSENQIIARLKNQMPFEEAKKFADVIIINNGTYEQLEEQVKKNIGQGLENVLCNKFQAP